MHGIRRPSDPAASLRANARLRSSSRLSFFSTRDSSLPHNRSTSLEDDDNEQHCENDIDNHHHSSESWTTRQQQQRHRYSSSSSSYPSVRNALQERLEEVLVLELLKDGGRNYLTLSIRSLYKHVLAAITTPPPHHTAATLPVVDETTHVDKDDGNGARNSKEQQQKQSDTNDSGSLPPPDTTTTIPSTTNTRSSHETPVMKASTSSSDSEENRDIQPTPVTTTPSVSFADTPEIEISFQQEHTTAADTVLAVEPSTTPSATMPINAHRNSAAGMGGLASPTPQKPAQSPPLSATASSPSFHPSATAAAMIPPPLPLPSHRQKSVGLDSFPSASTTPGHANHTNENVTYRERLGGYLHPRDMRRLVTPFSTSNEPDLMVRRHVMLLNFDPLRTIILRDRLLVLIPDGADSLLVDLERRVRGGARELETAIFGDTGTTTTTNASSSEQDTHTNKHPHSNSHTTINNNKHPDGTGGGTTKPSLLSRVKKTVQSLGSRASSFEDQPNSVISQQIPAESSALHSQAIERLRRVPSRDELLSSSGGGGDDSSSHGGGGDPVMNNNNNESPLEDDERFFMIRAADEWADIKGQEWVHLPFELQCADAVLQTVVGILSDDTCELENATLSYIDEIIHGKRHHHDDPLTIIRAVKDSVRQMTARVKGFVQSMNTILDDYEDMALMNLSRLMTHPERFIQPVPAEVLEEESDEPELLLESYLQQSLSLVNVLDLIQGQIDSAAELVDQKLDATRNKILLANTLITTVALGVDCATLVAGFFGMNLINHLEDSDGAFIKVTFWTLAGSTVLFFTITSIMYRTGAIPRFGNMDA